MIHRLPIRAIPFVRMLTILVMLGGSLAPYAPARAQSSGCSAETEPNNSEGEAQVESSAFCIAGDLPDTSDQDLFVWTVSADDAKFQWQLTVQGPDGTMTSAKILQITSDPGVTPVVAGSQLLEDDWTPTSTVPASEQFMVAPGTYLVGISRTDRGDGSPATTTAYTMSFAKAARLPKRLDKEPNDDATSAVPVTDVFALSGDSGNSLDYYAWTISTAGAANGWELLFDGAIGSTTTLTIMTADGTVLSTSYSDPVGKIHLYDLLFAAGTYQIQISGSASTAVPYSMSTATDPAPKGDVEPNDLPSGASEIGPDNPVIQGRLASEVDVDQYKLTVDDSLAGSMFDIRLVSRDKITRGICLTDGTTGTDLQCKSGPGGASLSNIYLPKGIYLIRVSGDAAPNSPYILRLDTTTPPSKAFETEPDDTAEYASTIDPATPMQGSFDGQDTDTFSFTTSGDPHLWDVVATGSGIGDLDMATRDGTSLATAALDPNGAGGTIYDQYLTPGEHWIRISGASGQYSISLKDNGPPPPDGEHEFNNDDNHAEPLLLGQTKTGRLVDVSDVDEFRFSLAAREHIAANLAPPSDGSVEMRIYWGPVKVFYGNSANPGDKIAADLILDPGDYTVILTVSQGSTGRYTFTTTREDPFVQKDDQEPNDSPTTAQPLAVGQTVHGSIDNGDLSDDYAIAAGDGRDLSFTITGDNIFASLTDEAGNSYPISQKSDGGPYTNDGRVPTDIPLYIVIGGSGPYTVTYGAAAPPTTGGLLKPSILTGQPTTATELDASLVMDQTEVAAYWEQQQTITGTLTLKNTSSADESLTLQVVTSHFAWHATVSTDPVKLAAGQSTTVPVTVVIDPDAWANIPVRITIGAFAGANKPVTAFFEVTPTAESPPIDPVDAWPVPTSMLGGLNLAATALGAVPANTVSADSEKYLYDGVSPVGLDFYISGPTLPMDITVDLAGDDAAPIVGFMLNPQSQDVNVTEQVRHFEIQVSTDGSTFTTAVTGELSPLLHDQYFALDGPVQATQARLHIIDSWNVDGPTTTGYLSLGEFAVIAQPGYLPSTLTAINLADPALGGHIVRMEPQQSSPDLLDSMLSPDMTLNYLTTDSSDPNVSFVIGFGNDRAAQLTELDWHEGDSWNQSGYGSLTKLTVEVSTGTSAGPWTKIGTWKIKDDDQGLGKPYTFKKPTWARFVRLSGTVDISTIYTWVLPGQISVIEAPMSDSYSSAIGAYGSTNSNGPYEVANPPTFAGATDENDASDDPNNPTPLKLNTQVQGRAQIGKDVDWYTVTAPKNENTLTLTLTGSPSVDVIVRLYDKNNKAIDATRQIGANTGTVNYVAKVDPGATYEVEVQQPPHSIMFTFDTSISMGPYEALVQQSVRAFAGGVTKGQEFVNVMAFEAEPLLQTWSDDSYAVYSAVNGYYDQSLSSSAEQGILDSTKLLSGQEGTTAILIITDAETSSFDKTEQMWQQMDTVQPRVFSVHVGGGTTPQLDKNLMQDWAFAGGYYQYTTSQADMDRAFDRAATWLRRPAAYGLTVTSSFVEQASPTPQATATPKKPGTLKVSPPEASGGSTQGNTQISDQVTVELILDTSGSMDAYMADGQRRIDAAHTVLSNLVTNELPPGIPVTLRVFGNQPGSCDTSQLVPLGPLDPASMSQTIQAIEPVNLVKTPIGASLEQVANDLAGVTGPKIVVLVTDGEETCDGDPAKAIKDLQAKGFDVQINIVGFSVDDPALKEQLKEWATLGNGSYFDATNATELASAVNAAVQAPYRVLDDKGNVVAKGFVGGDPIDLPAGTYSVEILTNPTQTIEKVKIRPGKPTEIKLAGT